jgi:hypothetical protein
MPQEKPKKKAEKYQPKSKRKTHDSGLPPGLASDEPNPYTGKTHRKKKLKAKGRLIGKGKSGA